MNELPKTLRYSSDTESGFSCRLVDKSWQFLGPSGDIVKNKKALARLRSLAVPPAYQDVWICLDDMGHLQMTGHDAAGRKQYRYHEDWRVFRDAKKFEALPDFGHALPRLRRRIARDLRREDTDFRFSAAALLRLIDKSALRVGNSQYSNANGSYGATTLRGRHVKISGDSVRLDFSAKGKKRVRKTIKDKTLNRVLERIQDLPGREIFKYVGADGEICSLSSAQVNDYLGPNFTAKTFRTWHGTVAAFHAAEKACGDLTLKTMAEASAKRLHNTPAISKSSYIHPTVLDLANLPPEVRKEIFTDLKQNTERVPRLKAIEARCLSYIERSSR